MEKQASSSRRAPRLRTFPQKLLGCVDSRLLGASLVSLEELLVVVRLPCSLHPESIRYAACRAFCKSPRLCEWVLRRSYRLRIAGKRAPHSRRFCLQLPISWFSLPEGNAFVSFSVSAEHVCLEQVWLLPADARPPHRVDVRLQAPPTPPRAG